MSTNAFNPSQFADSLQREYELKSLFLSDLGNRNAIEVSSIIVDRSKQKQGTGSAVLQDIVKYADQHGKILVLNPGIIDKKHGTTSQSRLRKFYSRFGFKNNKGRNKNYEFNHLMIRYPQSNESVNEVSEGEYELWMPKPEDTLGIERQNMPQVDKKHYSTLFRYLGQHGVKIQQGRIEAAKLNPIQKEFNPEGVKKVMADSSNRTTPLIVSRDNYIIDGHHRWLASVNLEETVPIIRASIPVAKLLKLVKKFPYTTYEPLHEGTASRMIGYKVMQYDPIAGEIISGADSRTTNGIKLKKGITLRMPGKGIYMSTNRDYVKTYYGGISDHEAIIAFEFDPTEIIWGNTTDVENEFTVPRAKIVDFEIVSHVEESMQLTELFTQTYSWKWHTPIEDNGKERTMAARFHSDGDGFVDVFFNRLQPKSPNFEVIFSKDGATARSDEGDQFKIISTVIAIIKEFITANPQIELLTFTAKRDGKDAYSSKVKNQRAAVYSKLLKRFATNRGFEFHTTDIGRMTEFLLVRKQNNQVNESFDKPYSYRWKNRDSKLWAAEFDTDSASPVRVTLLPMVYDEFAAELISQRSEDVPTMAHDVEIWEILFARDGRFGSTGEGGAQRIFSTVVSIVSDWFDQTKPRAVMFTAEKGVNAIADSDSRSVLYKRLAKLFAKKANMEYRVFDTARTTTFLLSTKGLVENRSRLEQAILEGGHDLNDLKPPVSENISITGTAKHQEELRKKLVPGTDAWFQHWFSRPHLTRKQVDEMKAQVINHINERKSRHEKTSRKSRTDGN